MITARHAADYILSQTREQGDPISNLKLQKLLYYAQAWRLALADEPLFSERLEAWVHGPVVPPVYGDFKAWSWQPILAEVASPALPSDVVEHLDDVLTAYGGFTGVQLERMTHSEEPWIIARRGLPPDAASNNEIQHSDMKTFYKKRLLVENQAG